MVRNNSPEVRLKLWVSTKRQKETGIALILLLRLAHLCWWRRTIVPLERPQVKGTQLMCLKYGKSQASFGLPFVLLGIHHCYGSQKMLFILSANFLSRIVAQGYFQSCTNSYMDMT